MTYEQFCPSPRQLIIVTTTLVALFCLVGFILVAIYHRWNMEIKVWLYAHGWCLWFITEHELDKDKLFDAFISYSHKDEDFIVSEILPNLEQGSKPYKLCLHFRNWQPGEFITKNIANSIADSRRTIVILSKNFLESEWGKMEFRTAHVQALSEGRARVIVVLLGEVPMDDLDEELKAYLSTNTYVKWGDPWFWDKLRYAMPHFPKLEQNSATKNLVSNDKSDLILELGTPQQTTPPIDKVQFDPMINGALNVSLVNGTLINNAINSGLYEHKVNKV